MKFAIKHFPLPFHRDGMRAAIASMCVNEIKKGRLTQMIDLIFNNQNKLNEKGLTEFAQKLGVNKEKFSKCLKSSKYQVKISQDIREAKDLGLKSVPVYLINGQVINGARSIDEFHELIDRLL